MNTLFLRLKDNSDVVSYKMAYKLIKQMYINGHFCYADKCTILTNRLDIVRHTSFIDDDSFKVAHPELLAEKNLNSSDQGKSIGDASALTPVHPDFYPDIFLGNSTFNSAEPHLSS